MDNSPKIEILADQEKHLIEIQEGKQYLFVFDYGSGLNMELISEFKKAFQ
jgi:hypothetical protein